MGLNSVYDISVNIFLFLCRDHPKTIKQRFRSVFIVSLLSPFYVWLWSDGTLGQNVILSMM